MQKILLSVVLLFLFAAYSSAQEVDSRLLVKYKKAEIQKIMKQDPSHYQFLINALDRGLFIAEIPAEKAKDVVFDGTLNIDPNATHTYLTLGKEILDRAQYFKIAGTNKMLVIQPKVALDPNAFKK